MNHIIVDYQKLSTEILNLLVEKFPNGYDDRDIISFRNSRNELIEAVEVKTEDTIYLVKVSVRLVKAMADFIEEYNDENEIELTDIEFIKNEESLEFD